MNRKIRKQLSTIREACDIIEVFLDEYEQEIADGLHEEDPDDEVVIDTTNWSTAREQKEGVYFKDLKELSTLKDVAIVGQVTNVFELKSYVKKDKEGNPIGSGLIYRFVLSDPTDALTVICFDKMAEEFKQYPVGTHLRITNAWKIQENKHGVPELHVGNFAKVEVVE